MIQSSAPIGRASLGSAMMILRRRDTLRYVRQRRRKSRLAAARTTEEPAKPFKVQINHRSRVKRQPLRHEEATDNGDTERLPQLGAGALAKGDRHRTEQRGESRHHDRAEAQQARLMDRLLGGLALDAL